MVRNEMWRRWWFIFDIVSCDSLSIIRFRSEDRVSYSTDAAAMDSVCCFTTFQRGRCVLSEGLETRPSACRMISLLTTADSKASLIQQRQQRISVRKLSMWHLGQLYFVKFQIRLVWQSAAFRELPVLFARRVEAAKTQVISRYGYGCCSSCLALLTYERNRRNERERLKEAQRGGVELFQAACKLLLFDHYIIASHAAPAVHSWSHSCACASSSSSCRWRVSNQYVAYQPVTVHPAGGDLVPGHLCYELCPQACQPGGSGGAPHCQLPRYAPLTSFWKWDCTECMQRLIFEYIVLHRLLEN